MVLTALTSPFRELRTLKLECLRVWCGLCHTCTLVRFPFPTPAGILYEGGLGLPVHYARVLLSLQSLEDIYLTLPDVGMAVHSPGLSADSNENMWAGECDRCMAVMYQDDAFKQSWLDRKRGIRVTGLDERAIYVKPPSLKKVHWKFWPYEPGKYFAAHIDDAYDTDCDTLFETESAASGGSQEVGEDED